MAMEQFVGVPSSHLRRRISSQKTLWSCDEFVKMNTNYSKDLVDEDAER